jgi:hypothetical protein
MEATARELWLVDVVLLPFAKPVVSLYGTCQHALAV